MNRQVESRDARLDGDILVACDRAGRTYGRGPTAVVAVHDATCTVTMGNQIAMMGQSGSGKSTLLHLFAGLDAPTSGHVTWPGIGNRDALRPGPVGMIFQAPSLLAPLDVTENVALPLLLLGLDEAIARQRALDALEVLELRALANKLPEELSGGQSQRVAIARVLASRPRLILADEPTGQLDHGTGDQVIGALLEAAFESGAALLVSTHDPSVAARFAIRWTMRDGRLTTNATPDNTPGPQALETAIVAAVPR